MDDPFAADAFAAVRRHPEFRAAVELLAAGSVRQFAGLDEPGRWIMRDLGRVSLAGAAAILSSLPVGLTGRRLVEVARANHTASRGRVVALLERLQAWDRIAVEPGKDHWMSRPIRVGPELLGIFEESSATMLNAAARLTPELAGAGARLADPPTLARYLATVGLLTSSRPDLFAGPDLPIMLFLARDGGMRILSDLIVAQAPDRTRLLEEAALSRTALAHRNGVSRTQVSRLLADGEALGLLRAHGDRVTFSAAMSDDAERHFALLFVLTRAAAEAAGVTA